ncbi:MAG TPA: hypothetical protein VHC18_16520 [Amycolatopsis sp.]|nr:hypothetical protein [Amycolatopsis sp.]
MRVREVWVHAVDLRAGVSFDSLPHGLHEQLITGITRTWQLRGQEPALCVVPSDTSRAWTVDTGGGRPIDISGPLAELTAVVTGRLTRAGDPSLRRWL